MVTDVPEVENADEMGWLPLGVFAMTHDDNPSTVSNIFLHSAVSIEGIIAGNYQNRSAGEAQSIEGMVDQDSQRAAWTVVEKNIPIMET